MDESTLNADLLLASSKGDLERVRNLITNGGEVNHVDTREVGYDAGGTPLGTASSHGKLELVRYLVDQGADVNLADGSGNSPLVGAVSWGHIEIARFLIANGARVDIHRYARQTVLNIIGEECGRTKPVPQELLIDTVFPSLPYEGLKKVQVEMATLLLENGSGVGAATMEGAINLRNCGLIRLLIEKGADVNRRFRFAFGEVSPLYLAILWNYEDIVEILLAHGATVSESEVKLAKERNRYRFLRRTMKRLGRRGPGRSWWPF